MPVNPIALKWLDALRSGEYEQADNALRKTTKSFCCLGVLCDVIAPENWIPPVPENGRHYTYLNPNPRYVAQSEDEEYDDNEFTDKMLGGFPPEQYLEQVGLTKDQARSLASMNDSGCTFAEIADSIEDMLADAG